MKIVFTGGHHNSALEVARKILETKPGVKILWLGHKHTMLGDKSISAEYKEVTSYGIPFRELKAGKVYKTKKIAHWIRLPYGFFQALYHLITFRPNLVVSFGGYLAVPVVLAAWILRIPSVTHEQTVVTGLANRLIARFAEKIFITWESSKKYFNEKKTILTGLPLRESVTNPKETASGFDFKNSLPTIYITGGKQGSHLFNKAIGDKLEEIINIANLIHQIGSNTITNDFNYLSELQKKLPVDLQNRYIPKEYVFENEIGAVFKKADLVISRSGAHTCYELTALGKPAILVPIPWVSHGEQAANAKALAHMNIARVLEESKLNGETLFQEIKLMLENIDKYKEAGKETSKKIPLDATDRILKEILLYFN